MTRIDTTCEDGSFSIMSLKDRVEIVCWGERGAKITVLSIENAEILRRGKSNSDYLAEEKLALALQRIAQLEQLISEF